MEALDATLLKYKGSFHLQIVCVVSGSSLQYVAVKWNNQNYQDPLQIVNGHFSYGQTKAKQLSRFIPTNQKEMTCAFISIQNWDITCEATGEAGGQQTSDQETIGRRQIKCWYKCSL